MLRTFTASASMLALAAPLGCSTISMPISPAEMPISQGSGREAKLPATVFTIVQGGINGYSQKTGKLTEQIAGQPHPTLLASDSQGNLYVTDADAPGTFVYRFGETKPKLMLKDPGGNPYGVAVSNTGEVAITDLYYGVVRFYHSGKVKAFNVVKSSTIKPTYPAYDASGNLYFSFDTSGSTVGIGEIVGGGKGSAMKTLGITNLKNPSGIAIDSAKHLLVMDTGAALVYQYKLPNPTAPSATIDLNGAVDPIGIALTKSERSFYDADFNAGPSRGSLNRFKYPEGGLALQTINAGGAFSVAVSPAAQP